MPPCSVSSMVCISRSSSGAIVFPTQSASLTSTSLALLLLQYRWASRRPASSLCSVYHGTQPIMLPCRCLRLPQTLRQSGMPATYPGAEVVLALGQLVDDRIDALLEPFVAGAGVHQRAGRQVVAERVAGDAGVLPPAVAGGVGFQPALGPESAEQAVDVERQEVGLVVELVVVEGPVEQADGRGVERDGKRRPGGGGEGGENEGGGKGGQGGSQGVLRCGPGV